VSSVVDLNLAKQQLSAKFDIKKFETGPVLATIETDPCYGERKNQNAAFCMVHVNSMFS